MAKNLKTKKNGRGNRRSALLRRQRMVFSSLFVWLRRLKIFAVVIIVISVISAIAFMEDINRYFGTDIQRSFFTVTADAGFSIKNILVDGRANSDAEEILALLGVDEGDSIFAVDPVQAQGRIEGISWIKVAHVERRLPDTIYIKILEREPLALWQDKGTLKVIDAEGVVLTDQDVGRFSGLFMVRGENAPRYAQEVIQILRTQPIIWERVDNAHWVDDRRWNLNLKDGKIIKLPENDVGLSLSRLVEKQASEGILDKAVRTIDVQPDRFIVQTDPGKAQDYNKITPASDGASVNE